MGITGLLSCLKTIAYNVDLNEYKGVTAGVDVFCWLHRGTYTCSAELVLGEDTDKYVYQQKLCFPIHPQGGRYDAHVMIPPPPPFPLCWLFRYISYCMGRVKLLQDHGITPILVFDGASLPVKRQKNAERRL